jgi:hypothetical protein
VLQGKGVAMNVYYVLQDLHVMGIKKDGKWIRVMLTVIIHRGPQYLDHRDILT